MLYLYFHHGLLGELMNGSVRWFGLDPCDICLLTNFLFYFLQRILD